MGEKNQTSVAGFILLGFSDHLQLQGLICGTVLLIYLISVLGNFLFLMLMCADPQLHKPMYFFLSNLSILDISYPSLTVPKMLTSFFTQGPFISFYACMTQFHFFLTFTEVEMLILAVMAYDRYVAICDPLRYSLIMKKNICVLLATSSWILSFLDMFPVTDMISQLSYCESNEIDHFFCDPLALIKLSCVSTWRVQTLILAEGAIIASIPFFLTLTSYVFIISTIMRIQCTDGRLKAFSTCASHLTSVILFYGTLFGIYLRPASMYSPTQDKLFSLLYTALIPMLNPIIYSLRNREIKNTFSKIRRKTKKLKN
uniref:Olfactory receptor n=1 Tax=Geotrypetes seraphini TaxID=260995 RepID=A0A6P8PZH5_GEOSA|nr:olfactory receptor 1019-like [Geotrypetes seraphini]